MGFMISHLPKEGSPPFTRLKIRPMEIEDIPVVAEMHRDVCPELPYSREDIAHDLNNHEIIMRVAEADEKVSGFGSLEIDRPRGPWRRSGHFNNLIVGKNYQGWNIGPSIIYHLTTFGVSTVGIDLLEARVLYENRRSRLLLSELWFTEVGERSTWRFPNGKEKTVLHLGVRHVQRSDFHQHLTRMNDSLGRKLRLNGIYFINYQENRQSVS